MRSWAVVFLLLTSMVSAAFPQVPHGVIAEDATATWCGYCPFAYQGLEVMKARYDANEFTAVRYYATSGGLGTGETDARIGYYGINSFPTVVFDGTTFVGGGTTAIAQGLEYDPVVAAALGTPSPLQITIQGFDLTQPDGFVQFDVEAVETLSDIGNVKIRVLILENNVTFQSVMYTDVTRDVLPETALAVSQVGQVQNVSIPFAVNPSWKLADLWIAILIQDDDNRAILQSASTRPAPTYSPRFWAKGSRIAVTPPGSVYEFEDFAAYNYGINPDVIRVELVPGTLPAGWQCAFSDGTTEYTTYVDLPLAPGEHGTFHMKITTGSQGFAGPRIRITSPNLPGRERWIEYRAITDNCDVLLVDDDSGTYENYHIDALQAAGKTYGLWPAASFAVTSEALSRFPIVIWEIGLSYPTLTAGDRAAVGAYLDGGGRLFITGQDLGWEMDDNGTASLAWYHQYMHADYVNDDANRNTAAGITGDPISDGMNLSLTGGDGANNNEYPEVINPLDGYATVIFTYPGTPPYNGALKVETSAYKVVYLGFGYESISTAANRRLLMSRTLAWLSTPTAAEDMPVRAELNLRAFPNPTPGSAAITYQLPERAGSRIEIYAPDGSVVRRLTNPSVEPGSHTLLWDGRSESGRPVPSGVYFYRLRAGSAGQSGKLVLTR